MYSNTNRLVAEVVASFFPLTFMLTNASGWPVAESVTLPETDRGGKCPAPA